MMTTDKYVRSERSFLRLLRGTTKRAAAILGVGTFLITSPVWAQEKTPANAFEFIRATMSDGSWTGRLLHCESYTDYDGIITEDCADDSAPIRNIYYVGDTYCAITFQMHGSVSATRTVDLRKQFQLFGNYGDLYFSGPVVMTNGDVADSWDASTTNWDAQTRVLAALEYLRDLCKPAGPW